ncbi:MAG: histidine phosphatase family protein [Nitrospirota bacterium]
MVTTLYLIRHGETEGGEVRRYKGTIDVPLSENGILQMERVSEFVRAEVERGAQGNPGPGRLAAVYCSDLSRAIKSAEIIARRHCVKPVIVPSLRERNFGRWEGMSFDEIRAKYPEEFASWAGNPLKFSPIEGESTLTMKDRVMKSFEEIVRNHSDGHIAIVAHGGVNRIIVCEILGVSLENIFRIEQDYGAVNIIEFHEAYPVVKLMNG